jgi:hypothetical protein
MTLACTPVGACRVFLLGAHHGIASGALQNRPRPYTNGGEAWTKGQ